MVRQRNRRIHFQTGFFGSFDAPWSERSWIDLSSKETLNQIFGFFRILKSNLGFFLKKRTLKLPNDNLLETWVGWGWSRLHYELGPIICKRTLNQRGGRDMSNKINFSRYDNSYLIVEDSYVGFLNVIWSALAVVFSTKESLSNQNESDERNVTNLHV